MTTLPKSEGTARGSDIESQVASAPAVKRARDDCGPEDYGKDVVDGMAKKLRDDGDGDGDVGDKKPKRKVAMLMGFCGTGYYGMQM
jgi:hypothetical protein